MRKYREFTAYGDNQYFLPDGGIIQNWNDDMTQYQWKLQGEFNKTFAEMHSVNFMAGFEMRGNKSTSIHTKGFGFDPRSLATKPLIFPEGQLLRLLIQSLYSIRKQKQRTVICHII